MQLFARLFLAVVAFIFLGLGSYNLFFPAAGMAGFEIQIATLSALNEIRANYGGMHFAMGLFFASGACVAALRVSALLVVALFTGGLVMGRALSLYLDGLPNTVVLSLLALEAIGFVAATVLFRRAWRSAMDRNNS